MPTQLQVDFGFFPTRGFTTIGPLGTNRAMPPKIRDVLNMLRDDGWYAVSQRGSHRQLKHPQKPGRVTVAGKPGDDVPAGLLKSILRQSGLKR